MLYSKCQQSYLQILIIKVRRMTEYVGPFVHLPLQLGKYTSVAGRVTFKNDRKEIISTPEEMSPVHFIV